MIQACDAAIWKEYNSRFDLDQTILSYIKFKESNFKDAWYYEIYTMMKLMVILYIF